MLFKYTSPHCYMPEARIIPLFTKSSNEKPDARGRNEDRNNAKNDGNRRELELDNNLFRSSCAVVQSPSPLAGLIFII